MLNDGLGMEPTRRAAAALGTPPGYHADPLPDAAASTWEGQRHPGNAGCGVGVTGAGSSGAAAEKGQQPGLLVGTGGWFQLRAERTRTAHGIAHLLAHGVDRGLECVDVDFGDLIG